MNNRKVGTFYEEAAVRYLMSNGYTILERNYHNALGEIDIIAKEDDVLVAVEVKFRTNQTFGTPSEAVTVYKQKKISRTFLQYYVSHGYGEVSCRFDVIAIDGEGKIEHIKDAFYFIY